jgi:hypothetical protein
MWSTTTGSEVMRPLAAPVIGGMLSSLVHILIVTPVLFAWLRERELKNPGQAVGRTFRTTELAGVFGRIPRNNPPDILNRCNSNAG